jgi:hypothetical protein
MLSLTIIGLSFLICWVFYSITKSVGWAIPSIMLGICTGSLILFFVFSCLLYEVSLVSEYEDAVAHKISLMHATVHEQRLNRKKVARINARIMEVNADLKSAKEAYNGFWLNLAVPPSVAKLTYLKEID